MNIFPTDLRTIIARLRKGPRQAHYGAVCHDARMTADALEELDQRVRALEGNLEPPTGEPGRRPE